MSYFVKYIIIVFGVIFLPLNIYSQNKMLETLKLQLKNSKHDTSRIKTYNAIGEFLYTNTPDSAVVMWEQGIKLAEKNISSDGPNEIKLRPFYKKQLANMLSNISYIYY